MSKYKTYIMKKKIILFLPIIYTLALMLLTFISSASNTNIINETRSNNPYAFIPVYIFSIFTTIIIFYICYYHSIHRKRIKTIIFTSSYFLLIFITLAILGKSYLIGLYGLTYLASGAFIGLLLYFAYDRFNKVEIQKELERQNIQSELALLKNQINPHFLFNTLNNIDSLIKSNPEKASDTLVELSDMMRYMIYETNVTEVPLKQELDYIDNYLKLQSLQYANSNLVKYEVKGDCENIVVPPMLFIPFIENAFKHCTDKESKDAISFSFDISLDSIQFEAINIYDENQKITKDKSSGVGLDIVKRRLEILYPNRHQLTIEQKNDLFCVSLKLKLND